MGIASRIISAFTKTHSMLPDRPSMPAEDLKAWYDQSAAELRTAHNGVITDLQSTTEGSSGADQIGAGALFTGDTSTPLTVMGKLRYAYSQFLTVVQGGIASGSILLIHLAGEVTSFIDSKALFKNDSATFAAGTSFVVTDAFITADTQVIISPDPAAELAGTWSVVSAEGSFTVTSSETEPVDVDFDWGATK